MRSKQEIAKPTYNYRQTQVLSTTSFVDKKDAPLHYEYIVTLGLLMFFY